MYGAYLRPWLCILWLSASLFSYGRISYIWYARTGVSENSLHHAGSAFFGAFKTGILCVHFGVSRRIAYYSGTKFIPLDRSTMFIGRYCKSLVLSFRNFCFSFLRSEYIIAVLPICAEPSVWNSYGCTYCYQKKWQKVRCFKYQFYTKRPFFGRLW